MRFAFPWMLLALVGCDPDAPSVEPWTPPTRAGTDDPESCEATPGPPALRLCPDGTTSPYRDGDVVELRRRHQGALSITGSLLFEGLPGGVLYDGFEGSFVAEGQEHASRVAARLAGGCHEDGVWLDGFELVFDPSPGGPAYDGLDGELLLSILDGEQVIETVTALSLAWVDE